MKSTSPAVNRIVRWLDRWQPSEAIVLGGAALVVGLASGRLRYQRIPAKAVASALSIGSGASVEPEDPSVQMGANLGSMFGQWLHLSDERMRARVAAGAAGGIAAAFNAPIAGVFFAQEIILGQVSSSAFGVVTLAAASLAACLPLRCFLGRHWTRPVDWE